jgi:hypothetical protein
MGTNLNDLPTLISRVTGGDHEDHTLFIKRDFFSPFDSKTTIITVNTQDIERENMTFGAYLLQPTPDYEKEKETLLPQIPAEPSTLKRALQSWLSPIFGQPTQNDKCFIDLEAGKVESDPSVRNEMDAVPLLKAPARAPGLSESEQIWTPINGMGIVIFTILCIGEIFTVRWICIEFS